MALAPGTRLGPYEIIAPLGAGGMGEVYRARDARLGRDVAIKVLPVATSSDPDRLRRFEQEARAAAALNHPNIMAIYDVGSHDGAPYVVSELLEGVTLRARLAAGALPSKKAVELALDVARGLAAAHAKGIVHRDLKPENLFVTREGRIKILDFGLAKLTQPHGDASGRGKPETAVTDTGAGVVLGTAGYMAPEQVRGDPSDTRADLFALGAILYEMLAGKRPFHRATPVETMNAILNEDPPQLPSGPRPVPPALERIVWHCLEKDPDARFQSALDVAFNLEALSGLSEPSGTLARPGKSRRAPHPLAALAILIALLAAAAVGWAIHQGQASGGRYHQLTFRKGAIFNARFTPDGQSYVYSAAWQGAPYEIYMGRFGSPESRSLGIEGGNLLGISSTGEMALSVGARRETGLFTKGTLARAPLAGGAPREIAGDVIGADWSPDGSSLATAFDADNGGRLEYPLGTVLFETKGWITNPRISPGGDKVAFLMHPARGDDRGTVMVVGRDRKARTLSQEWSTEGGLAWRPDGKEVWFTAGRGGNERSLYAASLSGKVRTVAGVPGGLTIHDIARDGRVLLAYDDQRADMCGLVEGDEKERDLTWLDFSYPADISRDGKLVLFSEEGAAAGNLYTTFVRGMDGSPAIRLGEGEALAFSPDAKSALVNFYTTPPRLAILPVGTGEARSLPNPGFDRYPGPVVWTPDGKNIVFGAGEPGKPPRCYAQELGSGAVRPITPEGFTQFLLSANGDSIYSGGTDGKPWAYPISGGKPVRVSETGIDPRDTYIRFANDGRTVFLYRPLDRSAELYRMDGITRRRTLVRELRPADIAGLIAVPVVLVSPDGRSIVFLARRYLSRLYLAEGLR